MTENKRFVLSAKLAQQLIDSGFPVVRIEQARKKDGIAFAFNRSEKFDAVFNELMRKYSHYR